MWKIAASTTDLDALAYEDKQVWISPALVRSAHQSGKFVVVHFGNDDQQLLSGDPDAVVAALNRAME